MKGPAEITLKEVALRRRGWYPYDDGLEDGEVAVVRIGGRLAVVDTTFSESDEVTMKWLRKVASLSRGRRLRAPLVVGLVTLRGRAPSPWRWKAFGARGHPQHRDNPIRCIALCVGGSHALMYQPNCYNRRYTCDPLAFDRDKMVQLRAFLANANITVACVGANEAARKLAEEWGVHVARPAELTDLLARAYGKVGVEAAKKAKKPKKYWMSKATLARAKAKAEAEDVDDDDDEVAEGLCLERMARVALGPEMRLARWPAKVADADWGVHNLGYEHWMYATRDAYLCFDVAIRCLQKLGTPVGS